MGLDSFGLGPERSFKPINYAEFSSLCERYGNRERDTFENLDNFRLFSIPQMLAQRKADGCAFMEKPELQILAEWRRKHDFSHKSTPGLLASNSIQTVRETTRAAFAIYGDQHYYVDAIRKLQELEGVSFPIATLLLAEYDPVNIPYFTEGLYRWVREEDSREGSWDRKIDYIMKQYRVLMERVAQLRGRFREDSGADVTALQVEKVARQVMVFAEERRRKHPEEDIFLFKPPAPKKRKLDTPQGSPPVEHQSAPVTENERPPVTESERTLFTQIERAPATEIGRTPVAENERAPKTKTKKVSLTWPTLKDSEAINDGRWRPY